MTEIQRPVVLFRASLAEEKEMEVCKKYFPVITQRSHVRKNDLVIPRYSALPWYKELEDDIKFMGANMINTHADHVYVADLQNWYYDLEKYTPKTWFKLDQIPSNGPFVLKGLTNSKKQMWNTHMFAENKTAAIEVFSRLSNDGYVGTQEICIRQFVKLRSFGEAIRGLPITEEYRFFVLDGEIVASAFYWSEHTEYIIETTGFVPTPEYVPKKFLNEVISIVKPQIRFFVIDVARTDSGDWLVIELNDGQMSGLSDNDPEILYSNMKNKLLGK